MNRYLATRDPRLTAGLARENLYLMPTESPRLGLLLFIMTLAFGLGAAPVAPEKGIAVVPNEAARRVDVLVDGQPFTSYIWPESLKVPTLWPLRTADGTPITRGFPLEPRPGERVDHPHHAGFWLNYGNVNGVDFWNNSTVISPERQAKMGTVLHRRIVKTSSGVDKGELEVETDWIMPPLAGGDTILHETASFTFRAGPGMREVDRISTLTALDKPVSFKDDKEGMLGLRVRKELEQPTKDSVVHTDAAGKPTTQKSVDNTGVSGQYRSSEGKVGDAVWGTRGRWCALAGKVQDESITVLMLDHPQNVGFPTYWHARGYGLFAANPLGEAELSGGKERLDFALQPKQSTTFRYRLVILDGTASVEEMEGR
ncbi:MAG TPA: PmoA family protein, partial [Tepidisphaeraceae bacterium]|nr:PmoA family protein [Tepidisphaeraceae bacterium]